MLTVGLGDFLWVVRPQSPSAQVTKAVTFIYGAQFLFTVIIVFPSGINWSLSGNDIGS